ncbi:MAG TPA: glycosyltransferase family 2 protein [Lacunisphaera sp.]|nr:glycosyltransferase family 2 protein [Lacunisphaera sp.]
MNPDLSIVIPFFNRADTVAVTLASIRQARGSLLIETILVDDGSTPPATEQLVGRPDQPDRYVRQPNQGLLFARLTGFAQASGEFVLFLDSDDLVGPEKLLRQIEAMRRERADVSYTDGAKVQLGPTLEETGAPVAEPELPETNDIADFFIRVQPPPHSPIFRTAWLRPLVERPLFPPSPLYNPVAEIWFYHVAAPHPGRVVKVPGGGTLIGQHGGSRITNQWEKMGVASLAVMEAFMRATAADAGARRARELVAEAAFKSWRALPRDFSPAFQRRMLAVWRAQPGAALDRLGGSRFRQLARWIGPVNAARLLRLRSHSYASCRTLDTPHQLDSWLAQLPAP